MIENRRWEQSQSPAVQLPASVRSFLRKRSRENGLEGLLWVLLMDSPLPAGKARLCGAAVLV